MRPRRRKFNPKRRIAENVASIERERLAERVAYGGNPQHKRNPGDFDLSPPAAPRPDKTLCDRVGVFERAVAADLLREGILKGLISERRRADFPQNVWAVTNTGDPVEAQLQNKEQGVYHGYPMSAADPLAKEVLERWTST